MTALSMRYRQARELTLALRNPATCFADWFKLRRRPYQVRTRRNLRFELRPGGGDRFSFYETVVRGDYLRQGITLEPGQTVIDVGANIGGFTVVAARAVGPAGRVLAIEPDAASFEQLTKNVRLNQLTNVTTINAALGDHEGRAAVVAHANPLMNRTVAVDEQTDAGVRLFSIGKLLDEHRIERCHFLKMDCEGAEFAIVRGMTEGDARRIENIVMETHPSGDDAIDALHQSLQELGYRTHVGAESLTVAQQTALNES